MVCLAAAFVGCGSDGESGTLQREARQEAAQEAKQEAARLHRLEARERRQARRRLARQRVARELAHEEAREQRQAEEQEEVAEAEASECDPNYAGACLDPNAYDYDCEGGSGDGPDYTGPVTVVGSDPYGLDADADGYGCE